MRNNNGFAGIIGLLLALVIIGLLLYKGIGVYMSKPGMDKKMESAINEQGINTSDYNSMIQSSKKKMDEFSKNEFAREKQLEEKYN